MEILERIKKETNFIHRNDFNFRRLLLFFKLINPLLQESTVVLTFLPGWVWHSEIPQFAWCISLPTSNDSYRPAGIRNENYVQSINLALDVAQFLFLSLLALSIACHLGWKKNQILSLLKWSPSIVEYWTKIFLISHCWGVSLGMKFLKIFV